MNSYATQALVLGQQPIVGGVVQLKNIRQVCVIIGDETQALPGSLYCEGMRRWVS
jgi:hypothetical protein